MSKFIILHVVIQLSQNSLVFRFWFSLARRQGKQGCGCAARGGVWDRSPCTRTGTRSPCSGRAESQCWTTNQVPDLELLVEETGVSPVKWSGLPSGKSIAHRYPVYFWTVNSTPFVCICILMSLFLLLSLVVTFKIEKRDPFIWSELPPSHSHVEVLSSSTSECSCIWNSH